MVRPTKLPYWLTLTLTHDIDFQSPASYGRDPYTCKLGSQRKLVDECMQTQTSQNHSAETG